MSSATLVKGYEISWAFLGAIGCSALPSDAFIIESILLKRGAERTAINYREIRNDPNWREFETEELRNLTEGDGVQVCLKVLQWNDYQFIADIITDTILDYTAECSFKDADDIYSVFPGSYLLSSENVAIDGPDLNRKEVSVTTRGWALPQGGVVFSWNSGIPHL